MTVSKSEVPVKLGRVSDSVANKVLTPSVVKGAPIPQSTLVNGTEDAFDDASRWEAAELRSLFDEVLERFEGQRPTVSDSWLAPRLHSTLRLSRAEAADSGLWNFIALRVAPDYVRWRWGKEKGGRIVVGQAARFSGRWDIQAISRLWWAAEIFRDGADYGPVVVSCGNQDVINTALRLEMNNHRPSAQALVRLLEKGIVRTGRDVNGLAKAAGAAGSTLVYEALAPDEPRDHEAVREWIGSVDTDLLWSVGNLPKGPADGSVPDRSIEQLATLFEQLFATAPVRGREEADECDDEGAEIRA
ncbi:DUF6339 family protein [Streptomyces sp. NPDC045456]|uniref:DUF6339 family protein n=1 Tax=Streptomyces sp. NPDC045456 TaxID=3155254 RepID=UPI003411EDED